MGPSSRLLRSPGLYRFGLASLVCLSGCGSRHVEDTAPTPPAVVAPRAQADLRALQADWDAQSVRGRSVLGPRFEEFLRRYPNDPGSLRVAVLYGWLEMEQGRLERAEQVLSPALRAKESANRDHARVVQAAVLTRQGKPEAALTLLLPLRGKLVDESFRELFGQERVKAALLARRWRLVVDALTEWLGETTRRPERVHEFARRALAQVPSHVLLRLLSEETAVEGDAGEGTYVRGRTRAEDAKVRDASAWIERSVIEQLTQTALRDQDARLARQLLTLSPSWLRASDEGERLALLAASGGFDARIEGRTIGFVYSEHDALARRRSSDASAGIVDALELGRARGSGDVRFLMRESRGDLTGALSALAGEGASILVAGVDDASATIALSFAEAKKVPLLSLTDPADRPRALSYGFVVGASLEEERRVLSEELSRRGAKNDLVVGPGGVSCDAQPAFPGGPRFPVLSWQREAIDGVIVLGDGACADQLAKETRAVRYSPLFGVGLEATYGRRRANLKNDVVLEASSRATTETAWYELLGRDAARLARVALEAIPPDTSLERDAVRAELTRARAALLAARAELETTSAAGFGGAQVLPRTLRATSPSGEEASAPSRSNTATEQPHAP